MFGMRDQDEKVSELKRSQRHNKVNYLGYENSSLTCFGEESWIFISKTPHVYQDFCNHIYGLME